MQYRSEFTEEELRANSLQNSKARSNGLFVSNSEIMELETDISVIMLRLLIENEELANRWRFACNSLLDCADILMSNGSMSLAKTYLYSAVDGTLVSPETVLTRSLNPQPSLKQWNQLRMWTLKKLLLCHRAIDDGANFVLVCLSLLDPSLKELMSLEDQKCLQRNVMSVSIRNRIVTEMKHHFDAQIDFESGELESLKSKPGHSTYLAVNITTSKKSIHDESFNVCILILCYRLFDTIVSAFRFKLLNLTQVKLIVFI